MAQITEKELSGLSDLLSAEKNIADKYRAYACETQDNEFKALFEGHAKMHEQHMDTLWMQLK